MHLKFHVAFISIPCAVALFLAGCQTQPAPVAPNSPPAATSSTIKLPSVFSDGMVLQQGMTVPVWGWGKEGETVTVTFRDQNVSAHVLDGKWMARLRNLKAGGPDTMTVSSPSGKVQFTDVLVGEVWVASGQSNMEFPLSRSFEAKEDIANSANPMIRLLTVTKLKAEAPTNNFKGKWSVCGPETAPGFSAVAYYFARDLQKARNVPVGIIHTSWGGSPAEVWMSHDVLENNPRYKKEILDAYAGQLAGFQKNLEQFKKEQADAKAEGKPFTKRAPTAPWRPTELYNGMIAPLLPVAIRGAIWYQGESNAGRAEQYRTLYADMIRNWRRDWNEGDFTFLTVQLAPFMKIKEQPADSTWAELREAQNLTLKVLPKTGIAVITDVGEENDIHPTKKQPVGSRLALAARGVAYGEKIEFSGPMFKRIRINGNQAIISFDHVGQGLEARNGALKGFAICGEDKKFVWGVAEIQGDTVVVSSPNVEKPVAVRYGWADYPVVNLWNKDGLPASPFRTDDFPMITAPKK